MRGLPRPMRALILAHGDGRRWDDFLGGPKHLVVSIDGETLLDRCIRLFRERGCEVLLIAPESYGRDAISLTDPDPVACDMSKFVATAPYWSRDSRTLILWGDCYYTEEAADAITQHPSDDYHVFRRPGPSAVTGHKWDESFCVSFGPQEHERVLAVAHEVADLVNRKVIRASHIRTHLAAWAGATGRDVDNVRKVATVGYQTHIDDWTDDFDSPQEWTNWIGRYYAGKLDVAVCVPWADSGCQWRNASKDWTANYWRDLGVPVYYGDCSGEPMNRSRGRNLAAAQATADGHEILFLADSDCYPATPEQFWAACYYAQQSGQLIRAFSEWHKLTKASSSLLLRGRPVRKLRTYRVARNHASCALAIRSDAYASVGGYDERFEGWGGEDRAFWLACNTLLGWPSDLPGVAYHLWHPPSPERKESLPSYQANVALGMRYKRAAGYVKEAGILPADPSASADVDAMRSLVNERTLQCN